jgi:hypothetical protein
MKKKSKAVNIALSSSAFISVYPAASAVQKKDREAQISRIKSPF